MRTSFVQHIKLLSLLAFLFLNAGNVCSNESEVPDFDSYKPATSKGLSVRGFKNPGFESNSRGWKLFEGYKVTAREGRNGSACLYYKRTDPASYKLGKTRLNLKPGVRYRYGAWVRTKNIEGKGYGATICMEYSGLLGNHITGDYPRGISGTQEWTYIESETTVPDNAVNAYLTLYLRKNMTGEAWFDDVKVEPIEPYVKTHIVAPAFRTVTTGDGRIRIQINSFNTEDIYKNKRMLLQISANEKTTSLLGVVTGRIVGVNLGELPAGKVTLGLTIFDPSKKVLYTRETHNLKVVEAERPEPAGACRIDVFGRAFVDGKPYMPIGLYSSAAEVFKEDMDRIAASSFNCVMPYNSINLKLDKSEKSSPQTVRNTLDYYHKKNIKVLFSLKKFYENKRKYSWEGETEPDKIVKKIVNTFKGHPALLAWYTVDEAPLSMLDKVNARRTLINNLDPFHPAWALYCQFNEIPFYASSCDVIGVDPYPVKSKGSASLHKVNLAMNAVDLSGMPCWCVPQIFNWGIYEAKNDTRRFKEDYVDPSEEQIRAFVLHMALRGAKGFIFYSYQDLRRPLNKHYFSDPPQTEADFERRWAEVCRVAALLEQLKPYILSDNFLQRLKVKNKKGEVQASRFINADGNTCVMLAGIREGKNEAVIKVNTEKPLVSQFGNTKLVGEGLYRFTGADICSDVLLEMRE